ncbi:MAG: chemotaxis protein CheD [Gemmatimonadetes bacterium]|nr:MAG: chemotaxis protein CheD [Gemmatimonadota bacterium]
MTVDVLKRGYTEKQVAGIAEMVLSNRPDDLLITYALGSCLGLCIYDPVAKVGGLIHLMLPSSQIDPGRAATNPERFVDTGVPLLFREAYKLGARKERIIAKVAGGASMVEAGRADSFQTGKRNYVTLKKLLWKNGVFLKGEDVGGNVSRTISLYVASGEVVVKSNGESKLL